MMSGNRFSRKDIVGLTSGQLTVVSFSHTDKKVSYWLCKLSFEEWLNRVMDAKNKAYGFWGKNE